MIVLDTTVLVYAVGSEHSLRDSCRAIVRAVADGQITATTTVEVIQEFAHVRARRHGRDDAVGLALDYAELLTPLLVASEAGLREGLQLFLQHPSVGSFDAVLAAAARRAGADALVSADGGFAEISGVRHVIPDQAGVEHLLKLQ